MSFIVFLLLFVALCGWLDARIDSNRAVKRSGQSGQSKEEQ